MKTTESDSFSQNIIPLRLIFGVTLLPDFEKIAQKIYRSYILQNQQRNTKLKIPLFRFVTKRQQPNIHTHATKQNGEEKQNPFRRAPLPIPPTRFTLIASDDKKCDQIDSGQSTNE